MVCFLKKIYLKIKKRKIAKRAATMIKAYGDLYLQRGLYLYSYKNGLIKKTCLSTLCLSDIMSIPLYLRGGGGYNTYVNVRHGEGKLIVIQDNMIDAYFYTPKGYRIAKRNYDNYINDYELPYAKILSWDETKQMMTMEKVDGQTYTDKIHNKKLIHTLLVHLSKAKVIRVEEEKLVVQHGDMAPTNIIWTDEDNFICIDLDNVHPYPPFLDILHYINSTGSDISCCIDVLTEDEGLFKKACDNTGIDINDNPFDTIFLLYLAHYKKIGQCYGDFKFLSEIDEQLYPKTYALLQQMLDR